MEITKEILNQKRTELQEYLNTQYGQHSKTCRDMNFAIDLYLSDLLNVLRMDK